ncbi:nuclear transport factor 2 family protein [Streptomyces sp. NPDC060194]|uniref:nuclear transport factor 2 family protein n=1 Tax=Streptomyces sp. NPDC060194 TaxID=3347069 RepID=UPI0036620CB6
MRHLRLSQGSRWTTVAGMTTSHTIAVLGLGRMGGAIATRLAARHQDVVGWTRSARPAGTFRTAGTPAEAVAGAEVVLLALFDGPACAQVLDAVRGALRPGAVVVNTGTVAPAEAAGMARSLGPAYVHAPLIGSVPAAAAGSLQILAAGDPAALDRVRPVLAHLGTVRPASDAAAAAALKLVANSSLAGSVLALRDALLHADALGVPRARALDVLELGPLGGLVARKRAFLRGGVETDGGSATGGGARCVADTDSRPGAVTDPGAGCDPGSGSVPGPAEFTVGTFPGADSRPGADPGAGPGAGCDPGTGSAPDPAEFTVGTFPGADSRPGADPGGGAGAGCDSGSGSAPDPAEFTVGTFPGADSRPGAEPGGGVGAGSSPGSGSGSAPASAEFTVGALAKDMALLAAASGAPVRNGIGLVGELVPQDADFAVAATLPAPDDAVLEPLRAYVRGHATGDPAHFRDAFLPTAHIEGLHDGAFTSWDLDAYCALFPGRPAPDEATRVRRVDTLDVHGSVATATMMLAHGPDHFTDVFLLVRANVGGDGDGGWRIANKAYHRHR